MDATKKEKRNQLINSTLIGFLIGIIIYSVAKNSWGLVTLIPLFLIYKLANKPKKEESDDM